MRKLASPPTRRLNKVKHNAAATASASGSTNRIVLAPSASESKIVRIPAEAFWYNGDFDGVNGLSFVDSRAALNGNDFIDWGAAGPEFTILASPFTVPTNLGMTATVSTSNGTNLERRDQSSGWGGNFAPGDHLIWNQDAGGDIVVNFGVGVSGVGAQVQADFFGAFTGTISAFGETGNLLGSFMFNGNSTSGGDNSAVFAGILDTTPDIFSVSFSVVDIFGQNTLAINQLDIVKDGGGGGGEITLTATVGPSKHRVKLSWTPADGGSIDVLRNGVVVRTVTDDGSAQDRVGSGGRQEYVYQVCETDTGTCSNEVTVRIPGR